MHLLFQAGGIPELQTGTVDARQPREARYVRGPLPFASMNECTHTYPMKYVAFIRGINVGGNTIVKMVDLKELMEALAFKDVRTVLASGNVLFTVEGRAAGLEKKIETTLKQKYRREISVLVRTVDALQKIEKRQPFKGIKVTKNTRLYVTFCKTKQNAITTQKHPGYQILGTSDNEIFSVLELSSKVKTPDVMKLLGAKIGISTMRNWNTVQKIIAVSNSSTA